MRCKLVTLLGVGSIRLMMWSNRTVSNRINHELLQLSDEMG